MAKEELREFLKSSDDKFNVLSDIETVKPYHITIKELLELIDEFLDDEQKVALLNVNYAQRPIIKSNIIMLIKDETKRLDVIFNKELTSGLGTNEIVDIIKSQSSSTLLEILNNTEFLEANKIGKYQIIDIIEVQSSDVILQILSNYALLEKCKLESYEVKTLFRPLNEKDKLKFFENADYIKETLKLSEYEISDMISSITDEKVKEGLMQSYELSNGSKVSIIKNFSDDEKEKLILGDELDLNYMDFETIMSSMGIDNLIQLLNNNTDFFKESGVRLHKVVEMLNNEKQKEFVSKIDELQLPNIEKRASMVMLKDEVKSEIDAQNMPEELKTAIQMKSKYGNVIIDFNKNLGEYRGLDILISAEPTKLPEEDRRKMIKLCEICPEMKIWDELKMKASTPNEYIQGEKYIDELLKGIRPEWSDIQKVAYKDNCIGKKLSYDPMFETEIEDTAGDRALWKILSNGYGVCNGIAQVENYILGRIGIEGEEVTGKNHAFIKLKNIELPQKDGSSVIGDTILDPTWNLSAQRFGARPSNFCISYEEIRKNDVNENGQDKECHKNDKELESANIGLDVESLREVYKQIGIADEKGNFPIKNIFDESEKIYELGLKSGEYLPRILKLLQEMYPDFTHSINETTDMLYGLLDNEKFNYEKCVIKRVYKRSDKEKMANLYVYADFGEDGKVFYVADRETGEFVELEQRDFEEQYECYQMDLDRSNGIRPWESVEKTVEIKNLTQSSGKVVACEGEER